MDPTDRIFLHNPLHDYESVWFIFHCQVEESASDNNLNKARAEVYKNRYPVFVAGGGPLDMARKRLPEALLPLCPWLVWMKTELVEADQSFKATFDGSKVLSIVGHLNEGLKSLEDCARGCQKRTRDEPDQVVEANEIPEISEEPPVDGAVEVLSVDNAMEEPPADIVTRSGGGQSLRSDDPFRDSGGPAVEPGAEESKVLPLKSGRLSFSSASPAPASQPARVGAKFHENNPELYNHEGQSW